MTRTQSQVNIRAKAGASNDANDQTPTANIVVEGWERDETADGATVPMLVSNEPLDAGNKMLSQSGNPVSRSPSDSIRLSILNVSRCEQCDKEFTPHRSWGRFYSAQCRHLAWLNRNPDKASELAERDLIRLRGYVSSPRRN